jgi:8-oxo-dGTP pyrophosphatase MutT (NUDIX family)
MTPDQLLAAVRSRTPVDERERFSIELFEHHLPRLARPYDEHADPVHVTGSAIVVGFRGVVLHKHKRLGLWLQPGGHLDDGETPADGALREAREETGLDVRHAGPEGTPDLVHVDVHPGPKGHTHLDVRYRLEVVDPDADPTPPEGESPDCRWFTWDEAAAVADAGLAGALGAMRPHH